MEPRSARTTARRLAESVYGRSLSALLRIRADTRLRRAAAFITLCVGLVVQMGLLLSALYLIDLSLSLFELWAELARKHLELTL